MQSSEDSLRRLRLSHNNRLAMFGPQMQNLVDAIQRFRQKFSVLPIGPIGSKIKLKDYTWATAVEQVIKRGTMFDFIADNHRDAGVLQGLIKSIYTGRGKKPGVIVSRFQNSVYDVEQNVSTSLQ